MVLKVYVLDVRGNDKTALQPEQWEQFLRSLDQMGDMYSLLYNEADVLLFKTVEDYMKSLDKKLVEKYKEYAGGSEEIQLLLPKNMSVPFIWPEDKGLFASIAYLAYVRYTLPLLEELLKNFEIITKGSSDFKGRLKENWLKDCKKDPRTAINGVLSAISELAVAEYLDSDVYKIINLGAWGDEKCDVTCERDRHFEVKYFSDSPEEKELINESIKSGKSKAGRMSNMYEVRNYLYYRIVEAVQQLEKNGVPANKRYVFFVFDQVVDELRYKKFVDSLDSSYLWYKSSENQSNLKEMRGKISIDELRKASPRCKDSNLEDIGIFEIVLRRYPGVKVLRGTPEECYRGISKDFGDGYPNKCIKYLDKYLKDYRAIYIGKMNYWRIRDVTVKKPFC